MQEGNAMEGKFLLFLLVAVAASHALCPTGESIVHVPAVVEGQEGGLLEIYAKVMPGNGTVYTSIIPNVGRSTQISQENAAIAGISGAGKNIGECDVLFRILDSGATSVDGPSAGMAMAVAVRASAEGRKVREDVAITGAVDEYGRAVDVGGLIDKAQAAARGKMRILLTPTQQIYEGIVLRGLSEKYNFTAKMVGTLSEAYAIATSPPGTKFPGDINLTIRMEPKNLTVRQMGEEEAAFAEIARKINMILKSKLENANGPLAPYRDYFMAEVERNERVIAAGYPYSGANFAFLSISTADFLGTPPEKLDLADAKAMVKKCISEIPGVALTDRNYGWLMGARARKAWAEYKLEQVNDSEMNFTSSEEKYSAVRELYYAQSWCMASKYLSEEAARQGGSYVDENALEDAAKKDHQEVMLFIEQNWDADPEAAWHIDAAGKSIDDGNYLASLYDSAYADAMEKASLADGGGGEVNKSSLAYDIKAGPKTLWGRLFFAQGSYLEQEGRPGGERTRVLLLSSNLERASLMAGEILAEGAGVLPHFSIAADAKGKRNPADLLAASIMMVALVSMFAKLSRKVE